VRIFNISHCHRYQVFVHCLVNEAAAAAAVAQSKRLKGRSYRAAMAAESSATPTNRLAVPKATKQRSTLKSPSGLIPEVVISVRPGHKSLQRRKGSPASSTIEDPPASDSDSDAPRESKRRTSKKRALIIESDDEDGSTSDYVDHEEEEGPEKSKKSSAKAPSRKRLTKGSTSQSSDHEESPAEETDSEEEKSAVTSDDESVSSSKKLKPKSRTTKSKAQVKSAVRKVRTPSSSDETEGDEMEVDDPPPAAKKKATKRKAVDETERPAKKQKRADSDPWKLESKPVQKDWTQMKAPPLEMFHFARKIVDEYTYLDGKIHSLVTRIAAARHWVLSGTPPIHDFGALKTIAAFLNLHLGIDDDGEGQSAEVKKRRREQTGKRSWHYHSYVF
jgi:hypothetical protein